MGQVRLVHGDMHGGESGDRLDVQFSAIVGALQPRSEIHANTFSGEPSVAREQQNARKIPMGESLILDTSCRCARATNSRKKREGQLGEVLQTVLRMSRSAERSTIAPRRFRMVRSFCQPLMSRLVV